MSTCGNLCGNDECFGLDPCPQCREIRVEVLKLAVRASEMTKDQAEKFFTTYGEAFDSAIRTIQAAQDELRKQRLVDKEALAQENEAFANTPEVPTTLEGKSKKTKKPVNGTHQTPKPESEPPASETIIHK